MDYKTEYSDSDNIVAVRFTGSINVNDEPRIVDMVKNEFLSKGWIYVMFDLSEIDYIDSAGMGSFLAARSILNNRKGELVLIKPSAKIDKILSLAGFNKIFKIFYDESEGRRRIKL